MANEMSRDFSRIPQELRNLIQWCVWKYETTDTGKQTKVPYNPLTGKKVSSTDRQTWVSFEQATEALKTNWGYSGLGFVFSDNDPYCGIDLDATEDPEISARQQKIFETFDSYAERSPSGKGLHIIIKASVPGGRKRDCVEIYSTARFFTMTGNVFRDAPINNHHWAANKMWSEMAPVGEGQLSNIPDQPQTADDETIIAQAKRANGQKFVDLWDGNWRGYPEYPSQSEADFALIDYIAFHTKNRAQIARVFRRSGLGQRKKAERDNYVMPMVDRALVPAPNFGVDMSEFKREMDKRRAEMLDAEITPTDLWGNFEPPTLPTQLLPVAIEQFARAQGVHMGADAGGLAMAALTTVAAAIPDHVHVKVKRYGDWYESARIWTALIGEPSTKKSPIIAAAARPLQRIDTDKFRAYAAAKAEYDALDKPERKGKVAPAQIRHVLNDTTIEAAQEVLKDTQQGVLLLQDELSGWFGSMDKYSGARGAAKDRGFWLQSFNGGAYAVNRIGRGSAMIENLSVCLLGGIQPEAIRKISTDSVDDGLLQRIFPIMLSPATVGQDAPLPDVAAIYGNLIANLTRLPPTTLYLTPDAQSVRATLEKKHSELQALETVNPKLVAHIGKYDGLFARLCIVFHCVEHAGFSSLPTMISGDTAQRVADFLHGYLLPHAISFFVGLLGATNDHDRLSAVAGYILAHKKSEMTFRDVSRGDRKMRAADRFEARRVLEKLESLGWLFQQEGPRPSSPPRWKVNPAVHRLYANKATAEKERRERAQQAIADALSKR